MTDYSLFVKTDEARYIESLGDYVYTCEAEERGASLTERYVSIADLVNDPNVNLGIPIVFDSTRPFHEAVAQYFLEKGYVFRGQDREGDPLRVSLEDGAENNFVILSGTESSLECIPSHGVYDKGIALGSENVDYSKFVSDVLVPQMTRVERQAYLQSLSTAYAGVMVDPDVPAGMLDVDTTQMLKRHVDQSIPNLKAEQNAVYERVQEHFDELDVFFRVFGSLAYQEAMAKMSLDREAAQTACDEKGDFFRVVSCDEEVIDADFQFREEMLTAIHCSDSAFGSDCVRDELALKVLPLLQRPSADQDLTSYYLSSVKQVHRFMSQALRVVVNPKIEALSQLDDTFRGFDWDASLETLSALEWQLKQLQEVTDPRLQTAFLLKEELAVADDGLSLIAPSISYFKETDSFWEGVVERPQKPEDFTLLNAETSLTKSAHIIDSRLRQYGTPNESQRVQIGDANVLVTSLSSDQRYTYFERFCEAVPQVIAKLDVPGDKDGAYMARILSSLKGVHIITREEMRARWLAGQESKRREAEALLLTDPEKAKIIIHELAISTQPGYVPSGLHGNGHIYLLHDANIFTTFVHELSHQAQVVIIRDGVLTKSEMESVYAELRARMPYDQNKISSHSLVQAGAYSGGEEWFTDALAAYWSQPGMLKNQDPFLYLFFSLLHNKVSWHDEVVREGYTDQETREWVAPETRRVFETEGVNPFVSTGKEVRQSLALRYYLEDDQTSRNIIYSLNLK